MPTPLTPRPAPRRCPPACPRQALKPLLMIPYRWFTISYLRSSIANTALIPRPDPRRCLQPCPRQSAITLEPGVEGCKSLCALDTSPPRNRVTKKLFVNRKPRPAGAPQQPRGRAPGAQRHPQVNPQLVSSSSNPEPSTLNRKPQTTNPQPSTLNLPQYNLNSKPQTINPKTLNLKPSNPKP